MRQSRLDSRKTRTHHEFLNLKLMNLFAQNFVRECRSFLGEGELMAQFKEILGWNERSALAKGREEYYQPPGWPSIILGCPSREELNIRYGGFRRLLAGVRPCRLASLQCHIKGYAGYQRGVPWP
jgi:paired amphipathic helix protein Sin3a